MLSFTSRDEIAAVTTVPKSNVIFSTSITAYIEKSRIFEKVLKILRRFWNNALWLTYMS